MKLDKKIIGWKLLIDIPFVNKHIGDTLKYQCNSNFLPSDMGWKEKSSSNFVLPESVLNHIATPIYEELIKIVVDKQEVYINQDTLLKIKNILTEEK